MYARRARENRGFTLLEVMIALAILAVAMVAILRNGGQSLTLLDEANTITTVSFLAGQKLSEIERDLSGPMEGDFGEKFPGLRWKAEVETPSMAMGRAKRVTVTVFWKVGSRENKYELRQYKSAS